MKKFSFCALLGSVPGLAYLFFLRPQMMKWGTRLGESQRRLPGDDIIPDTNFRATRAIDIDAPPEVVWPWLAQMGRDRSGWYGFDLLQNAGIPSATYIRSDLPPPQTGTKMDQGFEILKVEPGRLLLVGGFGLPSTFGILSDFTVAFLLERRADKRARLLVRTRGYAYGPAGVLFNRLVFDWLDFFSTCRQLSNIRALAEACEEAPISLDIAKDAAGQ